MSSAAELQAICRAILPALSTSFHDKEIRAEFYPYIGLTHTIRRRGEAWIIRISDHCSQAPRQVLESVLALLACKILRRKPPAAALRAYERFRRDPEVESRVRARRLQRGRKQLKDARGRFHALDRIYLELNRAYFNDQVEVRQVGWGLRKSWRRLGHYDPAHHTITISPVLDDAGVPESAVSYLLYHEMLHTLFDRTASRTRRRYHTPEFYRAEKAFPHYETARKFLSAFCRRGGQSGSRAASGRRRG
jgi:predicted metal-dependent hydrolase